MAQRYLWIVLAICVASTTLFVGACEGQPASPKSLDGDALAEQGLRFAEALEAAFGRAIEKARPSVVSVFLVEPVGSRPNVAIDPLDPRPPMAMQRSRSVTTFEPYAFASGIVLNESGLILTCYHAIEPAFVTPGDGSGMRQRVIRRSDDASLIASMRYQIHVRTHDGAGYPARVFAADPLSDLAVLELIATTRPALRAIEVGDGEKLFRGQFVLAIGNPYGTAAPDGGISASWGIVSNIRRKPESSGMFSGEQSIYRRARTLVQTDARLNMGISGGAMLNLRGQLVGVVMALAAATGYETPGGFAMPTDLLTRRILQTLRDGREVDYGFLGINLDRTFSGPGRSDAERRPSGARVSDTLALPSTIRSGLRPGDVIIGVGGQPVLDETDLVYRVSTFPAGTMTKLDVLRGQQRVSLEIELSKYPVSGLIVVNKDRPSWHGLRVDYLSTTVPTYGYGMEPNGATRSGVVVREVEDESLIAAQDIRRGQIIVAVDDTPVSRPEDFERLVRQTKKPVHLSLFSTPDRPMRELTIDTSAGAAGPKPASPKTRTKSAP